MNNIYLVGLARAGKDTVARVLKERLGMETYALADPIKDIMCALFMWNDEHRDGSYKEIPMLYVITPDSLENAAVIYNKYGLNHYEEFHDCWEKIVELFGIQIEGGVAKCVISPRQSFQLFGTNWGRTVDSEVWINIVPKANTIITDVRFDNEEAAMIERFHAQGIHIQRPGFGKIADSGHISENGMSGNRCKFLMLNAGSLGDLEEQVHNLADSLT